MNSYSRPSTRIALVLFLVLAIGIAWYGSQPPRPLPLDAPPTAFSGERALALSRKFATEPRPRGGHAAARGRDFIARTLESYGVEVEIQRSALNFGTSVSFVENVLGRIKGTDSTQTFGMTAHYDSVAWGPGAADDGAGVIVMLEAARALKCGPPLKQDVVFVFTGDEEGGGNGSVASLSHPWLKDLNVMLGLEGRGDWGTAYMFETSEGNYPLMVELAKSDAPAVSNSIMYQVHHQTPNTTDFTHMAGQGVVGYNVAFVGGLGYYHTANDKPEHLSPSTVQHQGEYAMALVRHYDNDGPKIAKGGEAVFFNTLGRHLIVYPAERSRAFAIAAGVLLLLALLVGAYTRTLTVSGVLISFVMLLLAIALTGVLGGALQWCSYKLFYVYIMYNAAYYHVAFMLFGLAILLGLMAWWRARLTPENVHAAMLLLMIIVLAVLEARLPITSYSVTWPLFFGAIGLGVACVLRKAGVPRGVSVFVQTLSTLPIIFFLTPGLQALYHMGGGITPAVNAVLLLVLAGALLPALLRILGGSGKPVALVLAGIGLVVFLAGWAMQRYTPEAPRMNSITYAANLDTNAAIWITTDEHPDAWVRQFVPEEQMRTGDYSDVLPGHHEGYPFAAAPVARLTPSSLTVLEDTSADGKRTLVLKYTCTRDVEETHFEVLKPAKVLAASVDQAGEVLADMSGWRLNVQYLPHDGEMVFRLTLDASVPGPVQVQMVEQTFSLPELTTMGYRPRPDWMIPKPNTLGWWEQTRLDSNHTYVTKTFSF